MEGAIIGWDWYLWLGGMKGIKHLTMLEKDTYYFLCFKTDLVITHQVLAFSTLRHQELFDNLSFRDAKGGLRSFLPTLEQA